MELSGRPKYYFRRVCYKVLMAISKRQFIPHEPLEQSSRWERAKRRARYEGLAWKRDLTDWRRERTWLEDRRAEARLFFRGTRVFADMFQVAFISRVTRPEIEEMFELGKRVGRTPPHAFALFVGTVVTVIALLYAIDFGLPWPMTRGFIVRTTFLLWQAYRICIFLGSMLEPARPFVPPVYARREKRPDISEVESENWSSGDEPDFR